MKILNKNEEEKSSGKLIKIILLQKVRGLEKKGAVVNVRRGYFRNFLSKGKAIAYNEKKLQEIQEELNYQLDSSGEHDNQKIQTVLENQYLFFERQASGTDVLYGSIRPKDISNSIKENFNITIEAKKISIPDIIKRIGIYTIIIDLSENSFFEMKISVAKSINDAKNLIHTSESQEAI